MSRQFALPLLLSAVLFSFVTPTLAAKQGHWEWTDSNGQPQYSDQPPSGVDAKYVESSYGKAPNAAKSSNGKTESGDDKNVGADKPSASQPIQMEVLPEKDPAICAQATSNLQALETAPRIRITDADGSKRILTGEEKEAQKDRARQIMKMHCE